MPTNHPQVTITVSEKQRAALKKAAADAGKGVSEFIRDCIAERVETWPDDLPGTGTYERNASVRRAQAGAVRAPEVCPVCGRVLGTRAAAVNHYNAHVSAGDLQSAPGGEYETKSGLRFKRGPEPGQSFSEWAAGNSMLRGSDEDGNSGLGGTYG